MYFMRTGKPLLIIVVSAVLIGGAFLVYCSYAAAEHHKKHHKDEAGGTFVDTEDIDATYADWMAQHKELMKNSHIKKYCKLPKDVEQILTQAAAKFQLSARSYMKMIKVARTIADLDGADEIAVAHMAEALQYKPKNHESA